MISKDKKAVCVYIDKDVYKKFHAQSIVKGKSVSERVNDFMAKESMKNDYNDETNEI